MQCIEKYQTPYKLGQPVIEGSGIEGAFDSHSVDIPFVFWHNEQFFMMYTGFNGQGYQTALSVSRDLLNWEPYALILETDEAGRWDSTSIAGTWILKESNNLYDKPVLKKVENRYWLVYHSYPGNGYETGPAEIGLAWCENEDLKTWHRLEKPVFSWRNGEYWERGGLYKACLIWEDGMYYMFYNAKTPVESWIEQTGAATSTDLLHWDRYAYNPILKVEKEGWDTKFLSDPCILKDEDTWLNFYFAYDLKHAQDGIALSDDLYHWKKHPEPIVPHGEKGALDETHAHKASIIWHNGKLYHFYCAVRPWRDGDKTSLFNEYRTISVASSQPF